MRLWPLVLAAASVLHAEVRLPAIISDHMLLQQNAPARLWGKADPGEAISVTLPGQQLSTQAGADGRWQVFLRPLRPGQQFDLLIAGKNQLTIHDVLAGDVWVGSGQSNMEFAMNKTAHAKRDLDAANYPQVRLFTVKRAVADQPLDEIEGAWSLCTPESADKFSAVLYFFGQEIHTKHKIPVGLIHTSWGGTPAQAWAESHALQDDPALTNYISEWQQTIDKYPARKEEFSSQLAAWEKEAATAKAAGKPVPRKPAPPLGPGHPNTPAGLYNAMVAPITPYAIRGVVWYQGESNAGPAQAYQYRRLFPAVIESWRKAWGQGSFPFYFVQLANYRSNGMWPVLRESQTATLELRNTGMALAIDVGNPTDIHPTDKQTVGHRLALAARAQTYGDPIISSGPHYRQMSKDGPRIRLWFDSVGSGLKAKNNAGPSGFWIAGPDKQFVPATAMIEDDTVIVTNPQIANPIAVRYAWADDPVADLYNLDGLPAIPFRTDDWPEAKSLSNR